MKWVQHKRLQCEKCAVWGKAAKKVGKKRLKQETSQKWRSKLQKRVTWKNCSMKRVPQENICKRKKVQHENSRTRKKVQHEKKFTPKRVQDEKATIWKKIKHENSAT